MKTRFSLGVTLTWLPLFVIMVPIVLGVLRSISSNKATGLGAVAGGISEALLMFGLITLIVSQVAAIVFLSKSFEKGHALRGFVSLASIGCSVLLLSTMAIVVWLQLRVR